MVYFATFHTHFGAVSFERKLKKLNINGQMMPVPRVLSASCGVGIKFSADINPQELSSGDLHRIYSLDDNDFTMVFENV